MNKWKKILIGIIAVILVLGLAKNILIKAVVQSGATFVTGAPVKIRSLAVGVFRPRIVIKDFKMYNPKGFPQGVMVDIPLIRVVYDLPGLLSGELHLSEVTLDLKEVVLYKNKEGRLNVDALKVAETKPQPKKEEPSARESKTAPPMPIRMAEVNLNLGQVVVKDYSVEGPVEILAYPLGVKDKTYKNINSPQELMTLILVQAMGPTALKSAGLYAAATVLGIGFLPAGVAGIMLGKDSAVETFPVSFQTAYDKTKQFLSQQGEIVNEDPGQGRLQAKIRSNDLTLILIEKGKQEVEITVKARKMLLPKPEAAEGLLYQLSEQFSKL